MNSFLLLCDVFSFIFWKKLKTPKRHFKINWPLPTYYLNDLNWKYKFDITCFFGSALDYSAGQCIRGIIDLVARLSVSSGWWIKHLLLFLVTGAYCGGFSMRPRHKLSIEFPLPPALFSVCYCGKPPPPRLSLWWQRFSEFKCLISRWGQSWERVLHKHKCIQITALVRKAQVLWCMHEFTHSRVYYG